MTDTGAPQEGPGIEQGPGQIDNPDLSAKLQAKAQEKAQAQADGLTIAQRLTRRSRTETIFIPFTDDLGEFFVEVRLPTSAELDGLMQFEKTISAKKDDPGAVDAASELLYQQLADLTTDPSLDKEFFRSGGFLASDLSQIIKEIMLEEEKRITRVSSFRKGTARARTV